ncbi:hypothetical protein FRC12_022926 [Ceratobasidium sp. 428]|nr:hypothetical protein FRC12_022926 [Ceratobasidium sp. 428]
MRRLWVLVALILASARSTRPIIRISALKPMLQRNEFAGIQHFFANYHPLPRNIDELQLKRIWYGTLEPMVSSGPVLEIDGGIIEMLVDHYTPSPIGPTTESVAASPDAGSRSEAFKQWSDLSTLFKARRARERWANIRRKPTAIRNLFNGPAGW